MSDLSYKRSLAAALCVAMLAAIVPARAVAADGPAPADPTATARERYQKGTAYYDLGKYTEAIREFEAAYELKNDPALLYNLAQSHRLAGNNEQALHFYRTYLRRMPQAKNRAEIEGRIATLEQAIAQKNAASTTPPPVGTTPPPGGTTTTPPPGTTGTTPGTTPGGTANSAGPPPPSGGGTAPPGGAPGVAGELPPFSPSIEAQPPPPDLTLAGGAPVDPGRKLRLIGAWTVVGGGALFLIGMIEGVRAANAASDINDAARRGAAFDPNVESRGKAAERAQVWLMVVGTLAAGVGGGLYFYGRRKTEQAQAQTPRFSLAPLASPSGAGALVRVTF